MAASKYSTEENKKFRAFMQQIHPDKNGSASESDKVALEYVAKVANAAKAKGDWFSVEKLIDLLAISLDALIEWAQAEMAGAKGGETPKNKAQDAHINERTLEKARQFMADNDWAGRAAVGDWLRKRFGMSVQEAKLYLDILFAKAQGERAATGYAHAMFKRLEEGPMSDTEFAEWVASQSANVGRAKSHWDNVRKMANAIWASK